MFARYPEPGRVKTRLIPALGAQAAAALHRRLVLCALRTADAFCQAHNVDLEFRFDGGSEEALRHWLGDGWSLRAQSGGDLGQRMAGAFEDSFRDGSPASVIIGSDCPGLTSELLASAFDLLSTKSVVLGAANDGGYYLIGMTRMIPSLFHGIPWGDKTVLADSLRVLNQAAIKAALLSPLDDIDRPEDLGVWRRISEKEEADLNRVSVIIPALNEVEHIDAAIQSAWQGNPHEVIVVDGGSADDTPRRARLAGARVLLSGAGRARQMNAGAARAGGNTLLFLHADTLLPPGWACEVPEALLKPGVVAGAFRFRIASDFPGRRIVECTANWRSSRGQMPYGDQALFLRRSLFEETGGYADMPFMEDYEFVRRLRRHGRIVTVSGEAVTSGRRWHQLGFLRVTLINKLVILGYRLGVKPQTLARIYRHHRR